MEKIPNRSLLAAIGVVVIIVMVSLILIYAQGPEISGPPEKETGKVFGSDLPGPYHPKAIENASIRVISGNPLLICASNYSGKFIVDSYLGHWYLSNVVYFYNLSYRGENYDTVMILHPLNKTAPRYISRNITLPDEGRLFVVARVANIEYMYDTLDFIEPCETTADNVIVITVTDLSTGEEKEVYASRLISDGRWHTIGEEITEYRGKNITFTLKSYAGGSELWCGEWGALDEFYIAQTL